MPVQEDRLRRKFLKHYFVCLSQGIVLSPWPPHSNGSKDAVISERWKMEGWKMDVKASMTYLLQKHKDGHPWTVKGRPTIPFTCIWLWFLINPLIKSQNFCREIHNIFKIFKWCSPCQVELIWACNDNIFFSEISNLPKVQHYTGKSAFRGIFLTSSRVIYKVLKLSILKVSGVLIFEILVLQLSATLFQNLTKFTPKPFLRVEKMLQRLINFSTQFLWPSGTP